MRASFPKAIDGTDAVYVATGQRCWLNGNQARQPQGSSHAALVIGRAVRNGRPVIRTIGGNESDTVVLSYVPANRDSTIADPGASSVFGMIKIIGC